MVDFINQRIGSGGGWAGPSKNSAYLVKIVTSLGLDYRRALKPTSYSLYTSLRLKHYDGFEEKRARLAVCVLVWLLHGSICCGELGRGDNEMWGRLKRYS